MRGKTPSFYILKRKSKPDQMKIKHSSPPHHTIPNICERESSEDHHKRFETLTHTWDSQGFLSNLSRALLPFTQHPFTHSNPTNALQAQCQTCTQPRRSHFSWHWCWATAWVCPLVQTPGSGSRTSGGCPWIQIHFLWIPLVIRLGASLTSIHLHLKTVLFLT